MRGIKNILVFRDDSARLREFLNSKQVFHTDPRILCEINRDYRLALIEDDSGQRKLELLTKSNPPRVLKKYDLVDGQLKELTDRLAHDLSRTRACQLAKAKSGFRKSYSQEKLEKEIWRVYQAHLEGSQENLEVKVGSHRYLINPFNEDEISVNSVNLAMHGILPNPYNKIGSFEIASCRDLTERVNKIREIIEMDLFHKLNDEGKLGLVDDDGGLKRDFFESLLGFVAWWFR